MSWITKKKVLIGIPAALIGTAVLGVVVGRSYCFHTLDNATSAFRERGFPTQIAEIIPPSVPENEDAAPLLERAATLLASFEPESAEAQFIDALNEWDMASREISRDIAAEAARSLDHPRIQELVNLAREAAGRPTNAPMIDYERGPGLEIPGLSTSRMLSRLLAAHVDRALTLGEPVDEVWSDIHAQFRLAELTAQPPTLLNFLTGIACRRIALVSLESAIDSGRFGATPDSLLESLLRSDAGWHSRMVNTLHGERLLFLDWITEHFMTHENWLNEISSLASTGDAGTPRRMPRMVSSMLRPLAALDLSHAHRYHFEIVDAVFHLPPYEWDTGIAEAEARVASTRWPLTAICAPMFGRIIKTANACWSEQRVWIITLAAIKTHVITSRWPQSISEIDVPSEILIDPCSGSPIHVVATEDKIVIYADGLDREDDGGTPWQSLEDASVERGDIVVELKLSR